MRGSQVPYAISAALVLVVSLAVLAGALAMGGLLEERIVADASPTPSATRAPVELSRAGRLAYWRTDPSGDTQLWVSNVDGGNRRPIAKIDSLSRVQATRWSPDGNAIAWIDRGQGVVVQRIDGLGARYDLPLPPFLLAANARLIDLDWSTDSANLAGTLRGGTQGVPNAETDVYVVPATGGAWRNVTNLGNAFLSQWISPTELLIHTGNGMIAVERVEEGIGGPFVHFHNVGLGLVPLTSLVATSPFVADDGRVYFLAGQVAPTIRDATVPVINAGQARVWSMTIDGGDIRQEIPQPFDDVRLVTRWSPGRFVVHQGASTALAFLASSQPLATIPGVIDRVVFSPDRRAAIGVSASRIVRYDTARPESPVVLLSDVTQPDAWYPNTVTLARSALVPAGAKPAAYYIFAMHGLVWLADASGAPSAIRQLQTDDRSLRRLSGVAVPQWSPRGDRILYFDVLAGSFRGAVFIGPDIPPARGQISDQDAAGPFPTWTPDGNVAYTDLLFSFDSAGLGAAGEVRIVSPTNGARVATYRAREIAFGGGKTYLIDNGRLESPVGYTDHAIIEQTATGTRRIATATSLATFGGFGGATAIPWQLSMLGASADGSFVSVRVSPAVGSVGFTFAVLRASDGTPTVGVPGQDINDVRWSPTGHLVGMTLGNIPVVRDAETGAIAGSAGSGRFAGWSPDGKWFYVARDIGLYAIPLAGGEPVRISALGVPVSTTSP